MPISTSPTGTTNEADAYFPLATYTFPSAAASYTFTSIPSTYDDLVIVGSNIRASAIQTMYYQINGDTGLNYAYAGISAPNSYGGTTSSAKSLSAAQGQIGSTLSGMSSTKASMFILNINQYSQTSYPKVGVCTYSQSDEEACVIASCWTGTAAISSIKILLSSTATYSTDTTFTLYGIKRG